MVAPTNALSIARNWAFWLCSSTLWAISCATTQASSSTPAEPLLQIQGFPLVDHAELPFGGQKLVVDRSVVKIEQREVPESWMAVPRGYRVTKPAARPRPAE